jgi:transaldolase
MKLLLDSADLAEIRWAAAAGLIDGVSTDPTLLSRAAGTGDPRDVLRGICAAVAGPVSATVMALDTEGMCREGRELAKVAENVVVRVPMVEEGLAAARRLAAEGIDVDVTLVGSALQGLLAAKAGAAYVSVFVGRLDDVGHDGMDTVGQLCRILATYHLETQVQAAALRHPQHVLQAALAGAHVAAVPAAVLRQLLLHPLTDRGLDQYLSDWSKLGHRVTPEAAR